MFTYTMNQADLEQGTIHVPSIELPERSQRELSSSPTIFSVSDEHNSVRIPVPQFGRLETLIFISYLEIKILQRIKRTRAVRRVNQPIHPGRVRQYITPKRFRDLT